MTRYFLAFLTLSLFAVTAHAAEPLPGDACAAANNLQFTSGPEVAGGGGHAMLCQGGTWKAVLSFNSTAGMTKIGNQTCATNEILKFNGTTWACAADASGISGLPALTATNIWVGNGSNAATAVAMSGDATLSNAGVLTIGSNAVGSAEITNASIALADLSATGTASATTYLRGDNTWATLSVTETDPQVGTLTASKWCAANAGGTAVDCTQDPPVTPSMALTLADYYARDLGFPLVAGSGCASGDTVKWNGTDEWECAADNAGGGGGGGLTLISTQTASASAALSWTALPTSTYNTFFLDCSNIRPVTNNTPVRIQFGTGAGPTWVTTGYTYYTSGSGALNGVGAAAIDLSNALSNTAVSSYSGKHWISNLKSTTAYKTVVGSGAAVMGTTPQFMSGGGVYTGATTAITAIRVLVASGNIAAGTCSMYGVTP